MKVYSNNTLPATVNSPEKEFELLRRLDHCKNVVKANSFTKKGSLKLPTKLSLELPEFIDTEDVCFLSLELCPYGDLFDLVQKKAVPQDIYVIRGLFL